MATAQERRELLKNFMQTHSLNVSRWAKKAGVSEGAVRNFLAGRSSSLNARTYDLLAAAADVPVRTLIDETDLEAGELSLGPEIIQYLPLISWVRAGEWTEIEDPREPGTYERLIPVTKRYSNRAYALRLDGDSMQSPEGTAFQETRSFLSSPSGRPTTAPTWWSGSKAATRRRSNSW